MTCQRGTSTSTEAPAVAVVDRLLRAAAERGASDLHLDPGREGVRVRMRRDGVLRTVETLPVSLGPTLVGRCKALADLLVYRQDLPQEGRIAAERSAVGRELRVATYPTLCGERVAVRFDAPDGAPRALEALGLSAPVERALRAAIERPEGVVLVTGPSGSGKTTTLYSCLHHLASPGVERAIVTVEDPVERRLEGVVQTEVDPVAGLDFARALRSLLRQDPDVLLVGEIRDRETAAMALQAGLTGHLVASTVHASGAVEVYARLLEMGLEPFVVTSAVHGVLAQRLLRRRRTAPGSAPHDGGCERCGGSGYAGRQLVAEWQPMTDRLRAVVSARGDVAALRAAAADSGFARLREGAGQLVADGVTDREEVERVFGRD